MSLTPNTSLLPSGVGAGAAASAMEAARSSIRQGVLEGYGLLHAKAPASWAVLKAT